jgi:ANTAR domain-containing protein
VEPDSGDSTWLDLGGLEASRRESRVLRRQSQQARARAQATRYEILRGRSQRQMLHDSAFARLQAKHESMAVIEQAKGIIMVQQGCGPKDAFDLLRRASQRTNVKVHVLSTQIVEHVASGNNVTPISLGAARYPRSRTRARPPA